MPFSIRIAGLFILALGCAGCADESESVNPNHELTGNFQFVYFTFMNAQRNFKGETSALRFDGDRRYVSDNTGPQITNHEGTVGSGGWDRAGMYHMAGDDRNFTLDGVTGDMYFITEEMLNKVYSGGLSRDKRIITAAKDVAGTDPSLTVAVRRQPGPGPTPVGNYHLLSLAHHLAGGNQQSLAGLVNLDGSGAWSGTADFNEEGTVTPGQVIDGTYSGGLGHLSFNGMIGVEQSEGAFGDLDTGVAVSSNGGNDPRVYILIREGSGLSDADLRGTYFLGAFIAGTSNVSLTGKITFDGLGGFNSSFSANDEGTVTRGDESGTYSVAANGQVTLVIAGGGPTYTGGIRPDGGFGAAAGVTDGEAPSLLTFTR